MCARVVVEIAHPPRGGKKTEWWLYLLQSVGFKSPEHTLYHQKLKAIQILYILAGTGKMRTYNIIMATYSINGTGHGLQEIKKKKINI